MNLRRVVEGSTFCNLPQYRTQFHAILGDTGITRKTRSGTRKLKSLWLRQGLARLAGEAYPRGSVVQVPFSDLSGRKRRPALVVSPEGFDDEDLVLCAITSRLPERFSEWEASLGAEDMVEERLPKRSVVKVGKLFTMHRSLIARLGE